MKFATGLVLAALAVTTANAGNPNYLRSTSFDDQGRDDSDFHVKDDDDLTIDLADYLPDSGSLDASQFKVSIMSLIGSGEGQVDLQDILDAFEEESKYVDAHGSLNDDQPWLIDSHLKDEADETPVQGDTGATDTDGSTDSPSWLIDDNSESMLKKQSLKHLGHYDSDSQTDMNDPLVGKGAKDFASYSPDAKVRSALDDVFDNSGNKRGTKFDDSGNENDGLVKQGLTSSPTTSTKLPNPVETSPTSTTIDSALEEYWGSMADNASDDNDIPTSSPRPADNESDDDDILLGKSQAKGYED